MAAIRQPELPPLGNPLALSAALLPVARRLRLARWLHHATRGALAAVLLSLLCVGLARVNLLSPRFPLELIVPLLLALGVAAGTVTAFWRPIAPADAARLAETRLGLKERLSSAWEFAQSAPPADPEAALLRRLQQEDAAAHARALSLRDAVPLRLTGEMKALLTTLLVLLLALLLPSLPVFQSSAERTERAIVQKEGDKLTRAARMLEKQAGERNLPEARRAAQDLQQQAQRMAQGRTDKRDALRQMFQLDKSLAARQAQAARAAGQGTAKTLAQVGQQLARSPGREKPASVGAAGVQGAAGAMQRGDPSGLSGALRQMAGQAGSGHQTPAQQQKAAQEAQKIADALKGTPLTETQRHAQAAADALKRGDGAKAADELRQAAASADRESRQDAQRQAQQAASQNDAQGVQQARDALKNARQETAQADRPDDVSPDNSGQPGQSGQQANSPSGGQGQQPGQSSQSGQGSQSGQSAGQGKECGAGSPSQSGSKPGAGTQSQSGAPGNGHGGEGRSRANTPGPGHNAPDSGTGERASKRDPGIASGAPHPLNPQFDPRKSPGYGQISLGTGSGPGDRRTVLGGANGPAPLRPVSRVPYQNALPSYRKSAETAVDQEDIPPADRARIRDYFNSLQPPPR